MSDQKSSDPTAEYATADLGSAQAEPSTKKARKPRKAKKRDVRADARGDGKAAVVHDGEPYGLRGTQIEPETLEWLVQPWIPRGALSLIVGLPSVGKSSFAAWLAGQARRAVILPGFEESLAIMTLPRMVANGAKPADLFFLKGRDYRFPRDRKVVADIVRNWKAALLLLDPVDSYKEPGVSENHFDEVRAYLESLVWIGEQSGAAIVGVRHPGKGQQNLMPGSRAWRDVPRSVVELTKDGSQPPKLVIRPWKDSQGQDAPPRYFRLIGERGQARRFELGANLDGTAADLSAAGENLTARREVMEACRLIYHLFEVDPEPKAQDLRNECLKLGIGDRARNEARRILGINTFPMDMGGAWKLERPLGEWPQWLIESMKSSR